MPFTVSEAISYIKGLGDATSPSQVYIKGTVSEIAKNGEFGSKFGNGSFFLSEDGTYSGSNDKDFEAFRVLWLGNKKWTEGNAQIAPGAEVVVCATVKSYNGVPETASGYVYSVNGVTTDANGIGTLAAPFNALGAIEAANAVLLAMFMCKVLSLSMLIKVSSLRNTATVHSSSLMMVLTTTTRPRILRLFKLIGLEVRSGRPRTASLLQAIRSLSMDL